MKKIDKITDYVSDLFDRYCMHSFGFFSDYDEDTDSTVEVPLFRTGMVDDETLEKISIHFGLTKEEIKNTDANAAERYWNKYPFFSLYHQYRHLWAWNQQYKDPEPTATERLMNAIFGDNKGISVRVRYDLASVKERLIEQLKEYDKLIPGTYHEDAEITDLKIATQTIFSFPQCPEMVRSFVEMVNRLKELFFKAIEQDLCGDEVNELNFLATWLIAKDRVDIGTVVTYDNILRFREIYRKENLDNFYDYVVIKAPFFDCCPWRCQEFFDDVSLVQEYVDVFPLAKSKMREFGMELTKFSCEFVWSDATPITYSDEEEQELLDFDDICGLEHIPPEKRAKERTHIYVDKNRSEIYGWGSYIKTLKKAYGPVSKGGVVAPMRIPFTLYEENALDRVNARIAAKRGGNANG